MFPLHTALFYAALIPAGLSGFCLGMLAPLPTATIAIELVVIDANGDEWIAGSGDTCSQAWTGAVIPENWVTVDCRPVSLADIAAR